MVVSFARGVLIGLAIAMPVGPIGVLCIRRSIVSGRLTGLLTGLGAATADSFYGAVAAFGLTLLSDPLTDHAEMLRVVGGVLLIALAVRTIRSAAPVATDEPRDRASYGVAFLSALALTLTNPATILSFAAVYTSVGIVGAGVDAARAAVIVGGVFVGSALWWVVLSSVAARIGTRVRGRGMRALDLVSAAIIGAFGVAAIASVAA